MKRGFSSLRLDDDQKKNDKIHNQSSRDKSQITDN